MPEDLCYARNRDVEMLGVLCTFFGDLPLTSLSDYKIAERTEATYSPAIAHSVDNFTEENAKPERLTIGRQLDRARQKSMLLRIKSMQFT